MVCVTVAVPGTCGELIQGWYAPWAEPVLVSCPITRYSRVRVSLRPGPEIEIPNGHLKARQAARILLDTLGRQDWGAAICIHSDLPPGRGMASSTADVLGVLAGLSTALEAHLTPADLARLACQIEPSDSLMVAGLAMLAYRGSARVEFLGAVPSLPLLLLDAGSSIDTVVYNAQLDLSAVRRLAPATTSALEMLRQGLAHNDPAAIGAAATLSATCYQVINHNPFLDHSLQWAAATQALGVVRAHSGGVIGLLYPPGSDLTGPARWLSSRFKGEIIVTALTGEGYSIIDGVSIGSNSNLRSDAQGCGDDPQSNRDLPAYLGCERPNYGTA